VKTIGPLPVRRLAAVCAAASCSYLALASHYQRTPQQYWGIGAPPPSAEAFVEAFLAVPGLLAGLPFLIAGLALGLHWLTSSGLVIGATFFWYCAGSYTDWVRDMLGSPRPPRIVTGYMLALVVLSAVGLPLWVAIGFKLRPFCANGAPPYWSSVLMYGIQMFWVAVGTFFAWRRFRRWRQQKHPAAQ
jgi:uncharacterized membrane protein YphA (DoxX/SURF4 family)